MIDPRDVVVGFIFAINFIVGFSSSMDGLLNLIKGEHLVQGILQIMAGTILMALAIMVIK